jgi:hypothetical protein
MGWLNPYFGVHTVVTVVLPIVTVTAPGSHLALGRDALALMDAGSAYAICIKQAADAARLGCMILERSLSLKQH